MTGVLVAGIITDVSDWLNEISGNWWFLLVILAIAFFDSVVPIVPSETTVIIGGVAAGLGNQSLVLVIAAGAIGAFLGDNTAYMIGRRMSGAIGRWAARKPKRQARLDWADKQIRQRGGLLLITARFIPGGRSVLTVSSGITHQPHAWFAAWVGVAAVIWATYAALLGYLGGKAFEDDHTKAFLLAFAAAFTLTVTIEVVRHTRAKRAARRDAEAAAALLER
jgi:membrane protein DedA with SNARE-associated domain